MGTCLYSASPLLLLNRATGFVMTHRSQCVKTACLLCACCLYTVTSECIYLSLLLDTCLCCLHKSKGTQLQFIPIKLHSQIHTNEVKASFF